MVSFNNPLSPTQRKSFPQALMEVGLSKKRKFDDEASENRQILEKSLFKTMKSMPHLESCPMPLEWQRCLDIKSGQIYFYNTRTHKRTSTDPRQNQEPTSPVGHMSLDLELNLPCGSAADLKNQTADNFTNLNPGSNPQLNSNSNYTANQTDGLSRSLSWLAFDGEQQEMVAAVCKKCHMLVMMCKSSPSCPNCKFMHPLVQSIPSIFKRRTLSLLC